MARKKKKKRRLKKGAALVLKWSIAMIIIGTAAFFLMNMVYNRGIYVKTHPLVLDMKKMYRQRILLKRMMTQRCWSLL